MDRAALTALWERRWPGTEPVRRGADVHLATTEERDRLKERHADWLSRHPGGW
ncbi:hypothetical protein [Kitasatospora sp. NPDC093102]|uniref:DUF3885 domain-containing protein n=1 Tax=Kitasatospora sp. NPDC093102 TaxID=3155069 RepID=UPI003420EB47